MRDTKYNNGKLSREQLKRLPNDKKKEYIYKELVKKFGNNVKYTCEHCATSLLYNDGYVSDDQLQIYI